MIASNRFLTPRICHPTASGNANNRQQYPPAAFPRGVPPPQGPSTRSLLWQTSLSSEGLVLSRVPCWSSHFAKGVRTTATVIRSPQHAGSVHSFSGSDSGLWVGSAGSVSHGTEKLLLGAGCRRSPKAHRHLSVCFTLPVVRPPLVRLRCLCMFGSLVCSCHSVVMGQQTILTALCAFYFSCIPNSVPAQSRWPFPV